MDLVTIYLDCGSGFCVTCLVVEIHRPEDGGGGLEKGVGLEVGILQFMCEHDQFLRRVSLTLFLLSLFSSFLLCIFFCFGFLLYAMRAV